MCCTVEWYAEAPLVGPTAKAERYQEVDEVST